MHIYAAAAYILIISQLIHALASFMVTTGASRWSCMNYSVSHEAGTLCEGWVHQQHRVDGRIHCLRASAAALRADVHSQLSCCCAPTVAVHEPGCSPPILFEDIYLLQKTFVPFSGVR